jgi:SAM-dependent methyltransferase
MKRASSLVRRSGLPWIAAALAAITLLAAAPSRAQTGEEVPFITTPDPVTRAMLQLARVKPHDHVIDLGSGDGRIVILAAQRFGARGLGVEIDPSLVQRSLANAQRAGVANRVEFREQDLFKTDLSAATVITMYLLPEVNLQLRPRLLALKPGTRIVSHDWDMGDWPPDRTLTIDVPDKSVGREKLSRVHLWVVPARVEGVWCSVGKAQALRLQVTQTYQRFRAELDGKLALPPIEGKITGRRLGAGVGRPDELQLSAIGGQLRVTRARGVHAPLAARVFERAADAAHCGRSR